MSSSPVSRLRTRLAALVAWSLVIVGTLPPAQVHAAAAGRLLFTGPETFASEDGGQVSVLVQRTDGGAGAVSATVSTAGATATAGSDFTASSQTVSWDDGEESTKAVTLDILQDTDLEGPEFFTVAISAPTNGAILGRQTRTAVRIDDDERTEGGRIWLSLPTMYQAERDDEISVQVNRSGAIGGTVSAHYTVTSVTATATVDYAGASSGDITFGPGVTAGLIKVTFIDDGAIEPNEALRITLTSATGTGAVLGGQRSTTLIIQDDETDPTAAGFTAVFGGICLPSAMGDVAESAGTATFAVQRSSDAGTADLDWTTVDATALAGSDYTASSGTLHWDDGDFAQCVSVPVAQDAVDEGGAEPFLLRFSNPVGATLPKILETNIVQILDDDESDQGTVNFAYNAIDVDETAASTGLLVQRIAGEGVPAGPASVQWQAIGITATAGEDFVAASGTATFAAGVNDNVAVDVQLIDDAVLEGAEVVVFRLSAPVGTALPDLPAAERTILDDDAEGAGALRFRLTGNTVAESVGTTSIAVRRVTGAAGAITVDYAVTAGDATADSDYDAASASGTLSWADGDLGDQTIDLAVLDDVDVEATETVTLTLSNPTGGATIETPSDFVLSITDDDANAAPILGAIGDQFVKEGAVLDVEITAFDPDGDPLTYSATSVPTSFATFTDNGDGTATLHLAPLAGDAGTYSSVKVTVSDTKVTDDETFTITVTPNTAPVADDQDVGVRTDTATEITLSGSDADADPLTYTVATQPAHGDLSGTAPDLTYTPDTGYTGDDAFTFTVNDGTEDSTAATVTIHVVDNVAPVASDDTKTTRRDIEINFFLSASDDDFDDLTYSIVTQPAHGTLDVSLLPQVKYTPAAGYTGPDSFTFKANDGAADSNVATVSITVTEPIVVVAGDDAATTLVGNAVSIPVLDNDTGEFLDVTSNTTPGHGTAACDSSGCLYTPTLGYVGTDAFDYTVSDGIGSDTGHVSLTIETCDPLGSGIDAGSRLTGERWLICSHKTANAVTTLAPTHLTPVGGSSALMTSGDVAQAQPPNDQSGAGRGNDTGLRGAFDVSILELSVTVPAGDTCIGFDLVFGSEEYPEFVNQSYNDAFLAELDTTDWSVTNSIITAPNNIAFDAGGGFVSVNSAFFDPGRVVTANGTQYDGATPKLRVQSPITAGAHKLFLSIFDAGDDILDSGAWVDGLGTSNTPAADCAAGANQDPIALDDQDLTTPEDTPLTIDVLANDDDPDEGDVPTIISASDPAHGTTAIVAGKVVYTPDPDYHGPDTFTYTITDGRGGSDTATVTLTVTPVNDAPVADDQTVVPSVGVGVPRTITLHAADIDSPALTFAIVTSPTKGTLGSLSSPTCTAAGEGTSCTVTVTYTASAGMSGADSFTFKANDTLLDSNTATVSLTIGVDQAPTASDGSATLAEDGSAAITLSATDPEGNPLTWIVGTPAHGALTGTAPSLTYTPVADYNGPDSFTFKVNDGGSDSNTATITLTITPVNDAPVATDGPATVVEDSSSNTIDLGALVSDIETLDANLTYSVISGVSHGTLTGTGSTRSYTPAANFSGSDSFTYQVTDRGDPDACGAVTTACSGILSSTTKTVTITVTPANDAPVADDQTVTPDVVTGSSRTITLHAADIDSPALTFSIVTGPTKGSLGSLSSVTCTPAGSGSSCTVTVSYTAGATGGGDSFTFKANDGAADSNTATVSLTVSTNPSPTAMDGSATVAEDGSTPITLSASDPTGEPLTWTVGTPAHGSLSGTAPALTYTPAANYNGPDSFTFKVNDGTSDSNTATVSVTVTPVNDLPVATDGNASVAEGSTNTTIDLGALVSDLETSDANLTYSVITGVTHGTLTGTGSTRSYAPAANYNGPDSFTYQVTDRGDPDACGAVTTTCAAAASSATKTVTISVGPANAAPVATDGTAATAEDSAGVTIDLAALVSDQETADGSLTYTIVTGPAHGSLTGSGTSRTFVPAANYNGPDSFTYRVTDRGDPDGCTPVGPACAAAQTSATKTVAITVTPVNDAPTATDGTASSTGAGVTIPLAGLVADLETGDANLVLTIVTGPAHGSLSAAPTGTPAPARQYTPTAGYSGPDTFTYRVTDLGDPTGCSGGLPACSAALSSPTRTITITVTGNRPPVASNVSATTPEDTALAITLSGSDPDGNAIVYSIVTGPAHGSLGAISGSGVTYTPVANYNGPDSFTYRVNDGTVNSNTAAVSITVTAVNDAPAANAGPNATVDEGTRADLGGVGTDIDGTIASYAWTLRLQGSATNLATGNAARFQPLIPDDGTYIATLTVCDSGTPTPSKCATSTATITGRNVAPLGDAIDPKSIPTIDTTQAYQASNFALLTFRVVGTDVPADPLSYEWDFGDGTTTTPQLGVTEVSHRYELGRFAPTVTIRDGDGGVRLIRFRRFDIQALGECDGVSSNVIAHRLWAWWSGGGTRVTVSKTVNYWFLDGTTQKKLKRTLSPGEFDSTRAAEDEPPGNERIQSGCVKGRRYLGMHPDYLPEDVLVKNP